MVERIRSEGASFEIVRGDEVVARVTPPEIGKPEKICTMADLMR